MGAAAGSRLGFSRPRAAPKAASTRALRAGQFAAAEEDGALTPFPGRCVGRLVGNRHGEPPGRCGGGLRVRSAGVFDAVEDAVLVGLVGAGVILGELPLDFGIEVNAGHLSETSEIDQHVG